MIVFGILGFLAVLTLIFFLLYRYEAIARTRWEIVAEGMLDRVAHSTTSYRKDKNGKVRKARMAFLEVTTIFFTDGRNYRVPGIWHCAHIDRGAKVRIRKNKWGDYMVEEVRE